MFNWNRSIQTLITFKTRMFHCWMKLWDAIVEMDTPLYKLLLINKIWILFKIGIFFQDCNNTEQWVKYIYSRHEILASVWQAQLSTCPFSFLSLPLLFCPATFIREHNVLIFLCFGKVLAEKIPKYQNLMLTCGSRYVRAPVTCDIQ